MFPNKKTVVCVVWFFLESLSKVSDIMVLLYDQGTEKTEESAENEAQKEDNEDAGNLTESQEKNVSVCFLRRSFMGFRSTSMQAPARCRESSWARKPRAEGSVREEAGGSVHYCGQGRLRTERKPKKDPEPRPGGTG